ncbi:MAG: hypothetical protein AAGE65_07735 [Planctomycetota bacterium]
MLQPGANQAKRIFWVGCTALVIVCLLALIWLLHHSQSIEYRWKARELRGASVASLDGYYDGGFFEVHTVRFKVADGGSFAVAVRSADSLLKTMEEIHLVAIGGVTIESVSDRLLSSGVLGEAQATALQRHHYTIDVGITGAFASLSPRPIKRIQDVIDNYPSISEVWTLKAATASGEFRPSS